MHQTRNIVKAGNHHFMTPYRGSVMTKTTSVVSHPTVLQNPDMLLPGTLRIVTKSRAPVGGSTLTARSPLLGAGQLSILASLSVLKGRRVLGS